MRIELNPLNLGHGINSLEIGVNGFKTNPEDPEDMPSQVLIEIYEGKLWVRVWDGSSCDPQSIAIESNEPTFVPGPAFSSALAEARLVTMPAMHTQHELRQIQGLVQYSDDSLEDQALHLTMPQQATRRYNVGGQQKAVGVAVIDNADVDKLILRKRILSYIAGRDRSMVEVLSEFKGSSVTEEEIKNGISELVNKGLVTIDADRSDPILSLNIPN